MTAATALLSECSRLGLHLVAAADKLRITPPGRLTPDLAERLRRHKTEILALLAEESLPARVRQRLSAACRRLGLDPAPVLARFDRYEPYPDHEWAEMARWDGATWEAHARLLTRESAIWGTNRAAR